MSMIKVSTTKSILALPPTTMTTIRRRLIRASSSSSSSSSSALAVMSNGEDLVRALRLVVTTHRSSPTLESSSPRRYRRINLQRQKQRADQWESPFATARVGVPTVVVPMLPSPISVSVSSSTLQSSSNVNILPSESLASLVGMEKDVILDNNPRVGDYSNKDEFDIRNSKSNSGNSSNNIGFLPNSPKHRKDQQSSLRIAPSKQEVGQRRQNPKMSEEGEWKWPPRRDNQQQEPQGYPQQEQHHQLQQQQKQQQQGRIIQQKNRNRGAIRNKQQPTYERSQTQYPQQNDPNRQQRQLQPYREEDTLERTLISYTRQLQRRLHDLRLYLQEHGHPTPQRHENQQQPTQSRQQQQQQQQQQQRHDRQQQPPYDPNDNQKHRQNNNNKNSDIQQHHHHHHHRRLHHKLEDKIDQTLNGILRTMSDMQLVDSSRSSSDTHNDVDMDCGNKKGMEKGTTLTTTIKTTTVGELATLLHDFCVIFADGGETTSHNSNNKNIPTNKNKNKNKKNFATTTTKDNRNYEDDVIVVPSFHTASYFVPSLIQSIVKVLRQKNSRNVVSQKRDDDDDIADDTKIALSSVRDSGDDNIYADNDNMVAVLNGLWGYTRVTGIVPPTLPPPPPSKVLPVSAEAACATTTTNPLSSSLFPEWKDRRSWENVLDTAFRSDSSGNSSRRSSSPARYSRCQGSRSTLSLPKGPFPSILDMVVRHGAFYMLWLNVDINIYIESLLVDR